MEIPFNRKGMKNNKTDLIGLEMRSPLAASLTARLLGSASMDTSGPTPKERIENWLALYRSLPEEATIEQLDECNRLCPSRDLPEAQRLASRLSIARARAASNRAPSP